ncbi:MazG nucleotide pyrophosphohydrolase domain-containing protein [Nitrosococcus oceani]|uniref:MazG nucleotide pyrophosphohydrolase domain-containing protein n=1 Tax=Nitrosococcus oceani TaxID=1229 RepID=UPI0004E88EC7|nr:MazG nucleotide pyrophosphohydrolase domain-containing protein [Nitrosococcus oceani]KFI23458.1 tetrapyrrole methylase [Nitrosococcus oceani]
MTTAKNTTQRSPHGFGKQPSGADTTLDGKTSVAEEQRRQSHTGGKAKTFASLPQELPALARALELQKRAAQVGFDWASAAPILEKIEEELQEVRAALTSNENSSRLQEEIGDLLFACINLARHTGIMPKAALDSCSDKFERRFRYIEYMLTKRASSPAEASLAEMNTLWEEAKAKEGEFN